MLFNFVSFRFITLKPPSPICGTNREIGGSDTLDSSKDATLLGNYLFDKLLRRSRLRTLAPPPGEMISEAQVGSDPGPYRYRLRERFFTSPSHRTWQSAVHEGPRGSITQKGFFRPQSTVEGSGAQHHISGDGGDVDRSVVGVAESTPVLDSVIISIRNFFTGGRGERGYESSHINAGGGARPREQLTAAGGDDDGKGGGEVGGDDREVVIEDPKRSTTVLVGAGDTNDSNNAAAGSAVDDDKEEGEKEPREETTALVGGSQRTSSTPADGKCENGGKDGGGDDSASTTSEKEEGEEGKPEVLERETFCPELFPDLLEVAFKFFDRDGDGTITRDVSETISAKPSRT